MISCSYPVEFITNTKYFYRVDGVHETALISSSGTEQHQDTRFSISDDRKNKVFSVSIRDVRGDDEGVYYCAVSNEASYHSLFTEIHLHLNGEHFYHHLYNYSS